MNSTDIVIVCSLEWSADVKTITVELLDRRFEGEGIAFAGVLPAYPRTGLAVQLVPGAAIEELFKCKYLTIIAGAHGGATFQVYFETSSDVTKAIINGTLESKMFGQACAVGNWNM